MILINNMKIIPSDGSLLGPQSENYRLPITEDFDDYLAILIKYVQFFHERNFEIDISEFPKTLQIKLKPLLKEKNIKIL